MLIFFQIGKANAANYPPVVRIESPKNNSNFKLKEEITFKGKVTDLEDGELLGEALIWTSDMDGRIGQGNSFSAVLSEGVHIVILTATDSGNSVARDSIFITIGTPPEPIGEVEKPKIEKQTMPSIEFLFVPPFGSFENLQGQILNADPNKFTVAVYIMKNGVWFSKPSLEKPVIKINKDSKWTCDITTAENNELAIKIVAYLIPIDYQPPLASGEFWILKEIEEKCLAKIEVLRKVKKGTEARQREAAEKERSFRNYIRTGSNHEASKEWEKAIEAYSQALKLKPDDTEVKRKLTTCRHNLYLSLAKVAESKGDLDTAILMYTTAISHKQIPSTQTTLDSVKKALKARTEAEARRREVTEKEQSFRSYSQSGVAHEARLEWEQAIDAYIQALKLKPDDPKVKDKLAMCRHNLYLSRAKEAESRGDLDTAIRMYTTAISHKHVPSTQTKLDSIKKALQSRVESETHRRDYTKWFKLAEKAEKDGSPTTAIQLYKEAQAFVKPEDSESLQAKIDSLIRQLAEQQEKDQAAKTIIDYGSLNLRLNMKLKGNDWVEDACFSPTGELIASTDKKQVRVWDAATGTCSRILKSNSKRLKAVCFSGDGKLIASGDMWAKIIKIWDLSSGKCLRTIDTEHLKDLFDISFSANGRFIVSASDDKTLKLWDVESGSLVRTYKGHGAGVFCVAFSPDGKCIASGSWDKTIRLWDVESGRQLKILKGHTSTIESLAFSPDGDYIAACEWWGSKIIIWDVEGARQVVKKELLGARRLAFSPDGHYVVSGDAYGQVHVLNVKNGEWAKKFKSHKGFLGVAHINAVGFSPNGKSVLAAADDKYVNVFKFE